MTSIIVYSLLQYCTDYCIYSMCVMDYISKVKVLNHSLVSIASHIYHHTSENQTFSTAAKVLPSFLSFPSPFWILFQSKKILFVVTSASASSFNLIENRKRREKIVKRPPCALFEPGVRGGRIIIEQERSLFSSIEKYALLYTPFYFRRLDISVHPEPCFVESAFL
jgi:hypothetical protein